MSPSTWSAARVACRSGEAAGRRGWPPRGPGAEPLDDAMSPSSAAWGHGRRWPLGADMLVELVDDGPVTLVVDT